MFDLRPCFDWVREIDARNVCLYFLPEFFEVSASICITLQQEFGDGINFMVIISSSGGVDTIATRVKNEAAAPDAVIYFGANCLCESRHSTLLPTLFVPRRLDDHMIDYINTCLVNIEADKHQRILFASDLTNCLVLQHRERLFQRSNVDVAKVAKPLESNWTFVEACQDLFADEPTSYADYDLVVFIGECTNLEMQLACAKMLVIDPARQQSTTVEGAREFRKRVALIEKFKKQKSIGIVFLNYNQTVSPIMARVVKLCKRTKQSPYYISLNQPDVELRLGNFGQLEGFVLVTSCDCFARVAFETNRYLHPIIFWKEFLISAKQKLTYGGIAWNAVVEPEEDADDETEEEMVKVDPDNMKLVDRELFRKPDSWYGLVVDAGSKPIEPIKEGQSGRASHYDNEQELF